MRDVGGSGVASDHDLYGVGDNLFARELGSGFRFGTAAVTGPKATLPKLGGKLTYVTCTRYKIRFQASASHVCCMAPFLSDREIQVGDPRFSHAR